jgi:hypothetical protein
LRIARHRRQRIAVWAFKVLDALRVPWLLERVSHLLARVSRLTEAEIDAGKSVLGPESISYSAVRAAEGRILSVIFKLNKGRAFTTFHTINLPNTGSQARTHLEIVVHELTHVFQYEKVGSVYIWQALRAQRTDGYSYGGWQQLRQDRDNGKHFCDFNREQQGQIAQDYYSDVLQATRLAEDPIRQAYEPYINELTNGDL